MDRWLLSKQQTSLPPSVNGAMEDILQQQRGNWADNLTLALHMVRNTVVLYSTKWRVWPLARIAGYVDAVNACISASTFHSYGRADT